MSPFPEAILQSDQALVTGVQGPLTQRWNSPKKKTIYTLKAICADFDSYSAQDMFGFIMNLKDPEVI